MTRIRWHSAVITWLVVLLLGLLWFSIRESASSVSLSVIPEVPRQGEPIIATFKISNPSAHELSAAFQFYADSDLVDEGTVVLPAGASRTFRYAYGNTLETGERLSFTGRVQSSLGSTEKFVSIPPYPPQIWSSFMSFASFSSTMMGTIASMTYYQNVFGVDIGLNIGMIAAVVLMVMVLFLELSRPIVEGGGSLALGQLRVRYSTITWILFIIFAFMVLTKMAMVVGV